MTSRVPALDLDRILFDPATKVIITCGSGGVGKTTTAAALALRAAEYGRRTAVLTIDPAKRLAQSMGLTALDNTPRRVDIGDAAAEDGGELWAMMLDTRRTFDEMVLAHSTPERAEAIFANPFYRTISSSFSGTQEYMAMEKLGRLAATGEWDLIVVDTPPSRSALDFLDAPQRLASFLDGRVIRMLTTPGRGVMKIVGAGLNLFSKAVTTIIGGQLLNDAAQFVQLFEDMFGGFRARAEATYTLLRAPGTQFLVVATCEADAVREASYFADRLQEEQMPLAGLVLNRTHPPLADLSGGVAETAAARLAGTSPLASAVLAVHAERMTVHAVEQRMRSRIVRAHPTLPIAAVPALAADAHDLESLREIGRRLTDQ
ncbi:ArsA family ATPase [Nakamurella silvestris]|nr:ArsA family ATPase [Nakamurella silvestris]